MSRIFGDACASVSDPYLRRACALAERGRGTTSPNPVVGCVLALEGEVVGEGWHEVAGGPHAEVVALKAAGSAARGSVAYVTLEPCAHEGRTPPCVSALVDAGVRRVVIGMRDPHPLASGGATRLEKAGVSVDFAADPTPFRELLLEWLHFTRTGRPFVRVKVASTLDGHPALVSGRRARISGPEAGALTMRLRAEADAVLVGVATAHVDDPGLTVRAPDGASAPRQPRRVLLARGEAPRTSLRMLHDGAGRVTVLVPDTMAVDPALSDLACVTVYPSGEGLRGVLDVLGSEGVVSLLVEPGPRLFSALYDETLIDELVLVHAGGVAGADSPALYAGGPCEDRAVLSTRMGAVEAGVIGADAVSVWRSREASAHTAGTDRS